MKNKIACEMCEVKVDAMKLVWNKQTQQNVCKECYRMYNLMITRSKLKEEEIEK